MSPFDYLGYAAGAVPGFMQSGTEGVGNIWDWLNGKAQDPNVQKDRDYTQGFLNQGNPYIKDNPYAGGFDSLIKQLQDQSKGIGPSLAGQAYNAGNQNAMAGQLAMAHGSGSAGAGRMAAQNLGNIQQGQAQGYAQARTGEQLGAMSQLGGALNSASQNNFQFQHANQQAWLDMLMQQLGLTRAGMGQKTNMDMLGGLIQGGANAAGAAAKM